MTHDDNHSEADAEASADDDPEHHAPDNQAGTPQPGTARRRVRVVPDHPRAGIDLTKMCSDALKTTSGAASASSLSAAYAALDRHRALVTPEIIPRFEFKMPQPPQLIPRFDVTMAAIEAMRHATMGPGLAAGVGKTPMLGQLAGRNWTNDHLRIAMQIRTDMARRLDVAVSRIDMSAYTSMVTTVAAAGAKLQRDLSEITRSLQAIEPTLQRISRSVGMLPNFAPVFNAAEMLRGFTVAPSLSSAITDLMRSWNLLSGLGHQLSNRALRMALRVRNDLLINPDRDAVHRAVARFMENVLGYTWVRTDDQVEAASSALLDDSWLPGRQPQAIPGDADTRQHLRRLTDHHHSLWRPIPDTTLCGRMVTSLQAPISSHRGGDDDKGGRIVTEADRLKAPEFVAEQPPLTNPHLKRMLAPLTPVEQEVVWGKYYDGRTWDDAATMCGLRIEEGRRIRRKFLRIKNAELKARTA